MEKVILVACLAAAILLNPAHALDTGAQHNIVVAFLGR